jgi:hypothetical protein
VNRVRIFVIGIIAATGIVFAQSTGTAQGVVKDSSGAIVPGANFTLVNLATRQGTQTTTTAAGTYSFAFVPTGEYSLSVDRTGLTRALRERFAVDVAGLAVVDVILQVGSSA